MFHDSEQSRLRVQVVRTDSQSYIRPLSRYDTRVQGTANASLNSWVLLMSLPAIAMVLTWIVL
ncbi:MAG: hypothetical protein H7A33_02180 [Deltaproteobacteria bacterium]|nr:hypothetical protein [Deltaproteobacteria bacterium]